MFREEKIINLLFGAINNNLWFGAINKVLKANEKNDQHLKRDAWMMTEQVVIEETHNPENRRELKWHI